MSVTVGWILVGAVVTVSAAFYGWVAWLMSHYERDLSDDKAENPKSTEESDS